MSEQELWELFRTSMFEYVMMGGKQHGVNVYRKVANILFETCNLKQIARRFPSPDVHHSEEIKKTMETRTFLVQRRSALALDYS